MPLKTTHKQHDKVTDGHRRQTTHRRSSFAFETIVLSEFIHEFILLSNRQKQKAKIEFAKCSKSISRYAKIEKQKQKRKMPIKTNSKWTDRQNSHANDSLQRHLNDNKCGK